MNHDRKVLPTDFKLVVRRDAARLAAWPQVVAALKDAEGGLRIHANECDACYRRLAIIRTALTASEAADAGL